MAQHSQEKVVYMKKNSVFRVSVIFGTQIKIFLMKSESFLTLHRQQHNSNVPRSRKVARTSVTNIISAVYVQNKACTFFFFAHKKYSRNFIKLRLNLWCHMDYFTDILNNFLDLGTLQLRCCLWENQRAIRFHKKYLNLCSEDEWRSYRFGMKWE